MKQFVEILEEISADQILEGIHENKIIRGFEIFKPDPEKTTNFIKAMLKSDPSLANVDAETLYDTYAQYPTDPGPGRKYITETEYNQHQAKLNSLEQSQTLTENLQVIPDCRDVVYWLKSGDRWEKAMITKWGAAMPAGSIVEEDLSAENQAEIAAQQESDRIAGMSAEQKAAELQKKLNYLADEADRLERRARIQGETFDAVAWYAEQKVPLEAKYA
jgi:hypothetical protein